MELRQTLIEVLNRLGGVTFRYSEDGLAYASVKVDAVRLRHRFESSLMTLARKFEDGLAKVMIDMEADLPDAYSLHLSVWAENGTKFSGSVIEKGKLQEGIEELEKTLVARGVLEGVLAELKT